MTVKGEYGKSAQENFSVVDTIPIPHPYCITPKHVAVASDDFCGRLDEDAIRAAEKQGAQCDICRNAAKNGGKMLTFAEHGTALVIDCRIPFKKEGTDSTVNEELHEYLKRIEPEATRNKYIGFAFKKSY